MSRAYANTDSWVAGGYSYNWVLKPRHWLINATVLPSVGYRYYHLPGPDDRREFVSTNLVMSSAVVYNHRALFAALTVKANGYFYFTHDYTFLNTRLAGNLTVGMRF